MLVFIDDAKSIQDLLREGTYDWIHRDITDVHFPLKKQGIVGGISIEGIVLAHFDRSMQIDAITEEFLRFGLTPITPHVLLSFALAYPLMQKQFPIVALDGWWKDREGYREAVYLCGGVDRRVGLHRYDSPYGPRCRFAGIEGF